MYRLEVWFRNFDNKKAIEQIREKLDAIAPAKLKLELKDHK